LPTRDVEFMLRAVLPDDASTNQLMPAPDSVLAVVRSEADLLAAIRARLDELGTTLAGLDAAAGLPDRFASKLFCGMRHISPMTLWLILPALGLDVGLIHNPAALAKVRGLLEPRKGVNPHITEVTVARRRMSPWLFNPERGRAMARVRLAKLKPSQRVEIARNAARTRWKRKCRKCSRSSASPTR
jgi:hypothetical protein